MLLQDGEPLRIGAKGQEDDSMGERVCCASLRNRVQIPGTPRKKGRYGGVYLWPKDYYHEVGSKA